MRTRRRFLIAASLAAAGVPLRASTQPAGKVKRIGFLYFASRKSALGTGRYPAFLQGLRDRGYEEGKHFIVDARFAEGNHDRLLSLTKEMVAAQPDVIVTTGTPANHAVRKATQKIPVVFTVAIDPVSEGLIASFARPGGNLTGLLASNPEISQKHLELMKATTPALSRVGLLWNSANQAHPGSRKALEAGARALGIRVLPADGRTSDLIGPGFAAMAAENVQAVIILGDSFFVQQVGQIADAALKHGLPSIYLSREYPDAGGYMSYGPDINDNFRRAAAYVDRIFKGVPPAELPIQQPTRFELVVNLKTARALGVRVPEYAMLLADQLIQ